MALIMNNIALVSMAAAAVCAMLGLLFAASPKRLALRAATLVLGAIAIVFPIYASLDTLGYPSPWPEPGSYEVLGWKFDEARRAIYTFVKRPADQRPRMYEVRFDLKTAVDLQGARQHPEHIARIGMVVTRGEEGQPEVQFEFEKRVVIQSPAEVAAREEEERRAAAARLARQQQSAQEHPAQDEEAGKK